jgi:hypothetical protein
VVFKGVLWGPAQIKKQRGLLVFHQLTHVAHFTELTAIK